MERIANLTVSVYSPTLRLLKNVPSPEFVRVTFRHLGMDDAEIRLSPRDPMLEVLPKGATVVIRYASGRFDGPRPSLDTGDRPYEFVGRVRSRSGDFLGRGPVTLQVQGSWRVLRNTIAYVRPGNPLTPATLSAEGQSYAGVGPAPVAGADTLRSGYWQTPESALPDWGVARYAASLWNGNLQRVNARLGRTRFEDLIPTSGFPVLPLGPTPLVRFGTLEEYIVPALAANNLGMYVSLSEGIADDPASEGRFRPHLHETVLWPRTFTPESGIVAGGGWSEEEADATDVVVGGPGEASARAFLGANVGPVDDVIEVFRDATGAPMEWPDGLADLYRVAKYFLLRPEVGAAQKAEFTAAMTAAASAVIEENAARASVGVQLQQSAAFYVGDFGGIRLGDRVRVAVAADLPASGEFETSLREVTITQGSDGSIEVAPQFGERLDDPDLELARFVASLAASNRNRATSR